MLLSVSKMLGEGMAMAEKMLEKVATGESSLIELEEKVRTKSFFYFESTHGVRDLGSSC